MSPQQVQGRQSGASGFDIPKRWPLVSQPDNRSGKFDKDARLINCYAEQDQEAQGFQIEKRFGLAATGFTTVATGRRMRVWAEQNLTFVAAGSNLYAISYVGFPIPHQSIANLGFFSGSGNVFYQQMANVNPLMVFSTGGATFGLTYYFNPTTQMISAISDPNFPLLTVPGFAFLDGTLYVMTENGAIYGSANLNDPTVWDPLNVIQANAEPDQGVVIGKQLTYVVAVKQWTTQFFYDAGNATGSPLAPVPGALLNYGCLDADTFQEIDGRLFWVTSSRDSRYFPQVLMLENLGMKIISTPGVERQLALANPSSVFASWTTNNGGHRLYGITNATTNITMVYDIDQQLWYQWTDYLGNYFPIIDYSSDQLGNLLAQPAGGLTVYNTNTDFIYPNDAGTLFPVDIYTPNFDAGVDRIKCLSQMRFNADQQNGSKLFVRFSDDDYQTFNNFRVVSLGKKRPILSDCGSFYRRAYHFRHYANTSFRINSVDLQMDIGTL